MILIFYTDFCLTEQNCQSCRDREYPYLGCCETTGGFNECTKCTNDPLNQSDDFRPFKKCSLNTSLIDYDDSGFPFEGGLQWSDEAYPDLTASERIIISLLDTESDIYDALIEWMLVCIPDKEMNEIDCDNCRMKVKWARDDFDMVGHPNSLAVTFQPKYVGTGGGPCVVDCDHAYIAINATNGFMDINPEIEKFPKIDELRFFYTNKNVAMKDEINWYHFKSTILHEIGHWLGLGQVSSTTCIPSGATQSSTVMWEKLDPMQERDVLSDIDKCMFMLLYCCDPITDVEYEYITSNQLFEVIPNPASKEIIVNYYLENPSIVNIFIFNNIGQMELVKLNDNIQKTCEHKIHFNTDKLSNGLHNVVLQINNKRINKKVIIQK